jgi:hypothetical protein
VQRAYLEASIWLEIEVEGQGLNLARQSRVHISEWPVANGGIDVLWTV